MDKRFWAIIGIIIIIFGGIVFVTGNKSDNNSGGGSNGQGTNHVEGKGTTGVTLTEYGDYECPYCGSYYPTVKDVVAHYGDQIKFQFRNLPLTQIHPNAQSSARAAEAAGLQGKFWEMHDTLYENQNAWSESSNPVPMYDQYAEQLGLNMTQFKADFASSKVNSLINADITAFNKTGAETATPAFFLNGKQIKPDNNTTAFEKLIDAAITKK